MRRHVAIAAVLVGLALTGTASANYYHPELSGRIPAQGTVTLPVKSCPVSHMRVQSHVPVRYAEVAGVRLLVNPHPFSAGYRTVCNVFTK